MVGLLTIAAFVALVAALGMAAISAFSSSGPRYEPGRYYFTRFARGRKFAQNGKPNLADVGEQLKAVMAVSFEKRRLLNPQEFRVFRIVEQLIAGHCGCRVFAQVNLGEILNTHNDPGGRGFHSVNSKRVDILIVDRAGFPMVAVEHQGNGHFQGVAAGRDAVKKEALRKAGVAYVETFKADSDEQIRYRVAEKLGRVLPTPAVRECPIISDDVPVTTFGRARAN